MEELEHVMWEQIIEEFCTTGKIAGDWFSQSHELNNMTFEEAIHFLTNN